MPFGGGVAESVAVDTDYVFPLPESVSFDAAAALPLNYLTAHFALVRRANLQPGETVLVQGAGGGVGSASCNMAAALGAKVIAVVSSAEKAAVAEAAGAHHVVLADGFLAKVRELTDGRGVDVVVDPVGGERFTDSLRSLAREGRLLVVGFTGGQIPAAKTSRLLLTNTTVMGAGTRELWNHEPEMPRRQWDELLPLLKSGALNPVIGQQFSLEETSTAIRTIEERLAAGKVLVRVRWPGYANLPPTTQCWHGQAIAQTIPLPCALRSSANRNNRDHRRRVGHCRGWGYWAACASQNATVSASHGVPVLRPQPCHSLEVD